MPSDGCLEISADLSDLRALTSETFQTLWQPPPSLNSAYSHQTSLLLLHKNKEETWVCWFSCCLMCTRGNNQTLRSHYSHLGGHCYKATALKRPPAEEECRLDSVAFHYRHTRLPKIREGASANIVGDLGMTASRSCNIILMVAGWRGNYKSR